eukprot:TRINITY_DN7125_c0_g1_i2.p3 TRINITY_DN7125_c0_g1~~TRINITY_DN7125_c0_g1_i2.p3  ORF type:complete len:107 (+),score=6.35 TRINITY_DN7125_c0_g1_i2:409-729(+)
MGAMSSLHELRLDHNRLRYLPHDVQGLHLVVATVDSNPLLRPTDTDRPPLPGSALECSVCHRPLQSSAQSYVHFTTSPPFGTAERIPVMYAACGAACVIALHSSLF